MKSINKFISFLLGAVQKRQIKGKPEYINLINYLTFLKTAQRGV